MPKSIKKLHDKAGCEGRHPKAKNISMKSSHVLQRKLRNTSFYRNNIEKSQSTYGSVNNKLADTSSSESVIYVGSYSLKDKFPIIDLTNSITNFMGDQTATSIKKYSKISKCHPVYSSIKNHEKNISLACTASTSHLLDSLEGPKCHLKKNSKSTGCLIPICDNQYINKFQRYDISKESQALTSNEKACINQITQLRKEDHDIIDSSLDICEDINILDECNPQVIINNNDSVDTLMKIYQVNAYDKFD